ncbi:MAG: hypothetical protein EGP77_09600 [Lachnospiraceae bacterium]|nr:hypothetical protein [Lachnospiraceae bacterium]
MSLVAPYVDGKLQTSTTSSDSLGSKSSNSVVDSDTFLTLLVAEMQNQDPLEPTSNTEWVSQYATFTQVQQISEMADSMDLVRANNLIGKEVVMKVTSSSTGETSYKRGVVDYVVVEEGKPLLVIDEAKYSLSDLDTVASEEYFNAYDKYTEFAKKVAALPSLKLIDKSYQNTVQNIMDLYNGMSDYEKNYLKTYAAGDIASYEAYVKKLKSLGVTFNEGTQTKETTLDDLISAFDKKMTALMEQIAALKGSNSSSGSSSSGNTDQKTDGITSGGNDQKTDGTTSGDKNQKTDGTESGDKNQKTDGSESGDNTQVSDKTPSTDDSQKTENPDSGDNNSDKNQESGSMDATGSAADADNAQTDNSSNNTASGDEDIADLLTQDNTTV